MPFISKSFIDKIHEESDMVSIIGDYVKLKKSGSGHKGKSPWTEDRSASFMVSKSKGIWKDFSSGKGGNNAISFIMEHDGLSYPEAVELVAHKMGIEVEYEDNEATKQYQAEQEKKIELQPLLQAVINKYKEAFKSLPENHPAKIEVFHKRQYNWDIVEKYDIGYAPGNKFIYNLCVDNGVKSEALELGLIVESQNDKVYNRVIYPIIEKKGKNLAPVGLAGRDLSGKKEAAKWVNSSDSLLYKKESVWYGLDKARESIVKNQKAWLVEGYNDVIAWQTHGILNTIASCGTAIAVKQIKILRKLCDTVVFCMDPDAAGIRSMLKYIPLFLEHGFRVETLILDVDPDDFVRTHKKSLVLEPDFFSTTIHEFLEDGFKFLIENNIQPKKGVEKGKATKKLTETIAKIKDDAIQLIYSEWLAKESGVKIGMINKWIKVFSYVPEEDRKEIKKSITEDEYYVLPKVVTEDIDVLKPIIERYQMFIANNQIWSQIGNEPPFTFRSVSNFSIEIIQHMRDEEYPKKLVSAENKFKESFVFDVPSDTFNVAAAFQKAMTNFGNFRWHGRTDDLVRLQALLFDKMGNGRSLDVLGWQHEGFYLFNNLVVVPGEDNIELDKNGCFKFRGVSYYVPSANCIYKENPYKYMPQKKFRHIPGTITSLEYFAKVFRVHGNHAISSIFHAIACMFQDIVAKALKGFPINFSYGPPGTGKDELNHAVKSLWGIPQEATNLEGKNATKTATIRELAQFSNTLLEWSEYARGDSELDGTIKSVWDLRGKKIGQRESRVATDNIPVLSGISLTGNEYPDNAAIITRIIWNDMNRTDFTEEDEKEFNELNDIIDEGVTHITIKILNKRELVKANFNREYRLLMDVYQRRMPDCNKRMLKNISTLTAFYNLLKDEIDFPFSQNQILDHFTTISEAQMRKLTSSSIVTRWWDCFVASMRGTLEDQILVTRDLALNGKLLYLQFTNCYNKVQRQWFSQYRDSAPAKGTMMDALKKDDSYHNYKSTHSFSTGANRNQSSAMVIDITKLPEDITGLIKAEVNRQEYEKNLGTYAPKTIINQPEAEPVNNNTGTQTDFNFKNK